MGCMGEGLRHGSPFGGLCRAPARPFANASRPPHHIEDGFRPGIG